MISPSVVTPTAHTKFHAIGGIDGGACNAAAIRSANCTSASPADLRTKPARAAAAIASRSARAAVTGIGAAAAAFCCWLVDIGATPGPAGPPVPAPG